MLGGVLVECRHIGFDIPQRRAVQDIHVFDMQNIPSRRSSRTTDTSIGLGRLGARVANNLCFSLPRNGVTVRLYPSAR